MDIFSRTDEQEERIERMNILNLDINLWTKIIDFATEWSKEYFQQDWAQWGEHAEFPTEYYNGVYGYRMWMHMSDYPWIEAVDVLLFPDGSLSAVSIMDWFEYPLADDREARERICNKRLEYYSSAYSHITRMAEQWSKEYFVQDQVQIITIYQYPKEYPGYVYGYQIEIILPKQAQREIVHILLAPDGNLSAKYVGSAPLP